MQFHNRSAGIVFPAGFIDLEIEILCREPDWQLASVERVCNSFDPLSVVKDLYINAIRQ
jgi:hypothetical protein